MLKSPLIHPEISFALGCSGHGAMVLIADGNFPVGISTPHTSTKVYLNLAPGICKITDVLKTLLASIPVESAIAMTPAHGVSGTLHSEYSALLGTIPMTTVDKQQFYQHAISEKNCLTIVTGDTRRFANIILTTGVYTHTETFENAEVHQLTDTIL
jgi:L-fucose mutarotase